MRPAVSALRGLVLLYRYTLSAFVGRSCRFLPTCSDYALEALDTHGAAQGTWLTLRRLARCHPWGGAGLDPVPAPEAAAGGVTSRHCHCSEPAVAAISHGIDKQSHGHRAPRRTAR